MFIYFHCSTVNNYKYKRKYLLRRIPHASHGRFNPFAISNKQARIQWEYTSCVTVRYVFLSASENLRTINAFVNVLIAMVKHS